jgi:PAS domain S-box-containing protein
LLVDNEPDNLEILQAYLAGPGVDLVLASSGHQALAQTSARDFAVIVLDLHMPGLSGFEVAQKVRANAPDNLTPIIFVTGSEPGAFPVEQAYALGAVDYLVKPVNPTILGAKVAVFVELYRNKKALAAAESARQALAGERQLQESRDLFSLLLESSVEGIFGIRVDTSCMFFNQAGAAMLGYTPEELAGRQLHELIHHHHPDSSVYPLGQCPIQQAAQGGASRRIEEEVFWHKNGTPVQVAYSVAPMTVLGKPTGAVITFSDITQRKRSNAEREHLLKEVQAANDRIADVFKHAPAFMAVLRGPEHACEMVNNRYVEMVGNRNQLGRTVRQALPELAGQGFYELLDQVFATGEPFVGFDMPIALQRRTGQPIEMRYVDFVYTALRDANGAVSGVLVHGVDQTERKQAEAALRASQERYRMLFESMAQGFCLLEMIGGDTDTTKDNAPVDFRIVEANAMVYKHAGIVNPVGKTIRALSSNVENRWIKHLTMAAQSSQPIQFDDFSPNTNRWLDVHAQRVGKPESRVIALLFTNITTRKRAEKDLRQLAASLAETDRRKTEFLATLAHELRNPLAPITAGLGMVRMQVDAAEAPQALGQTLSPTLDMLERQVGHMVDLIEELLDIARISGGKLALKKRLITLQAIVAVAIETSQPHILQGRHALRVCMPDASDDELVLDADPTRIAQVLANLLNNAAKYTPPGGQIELSVCRQGQGVVISVRDSGIGLAPENLEPIFELFSQADLSANRAHGGLGIGLSLVRQLVQMHGGVVSAASAGVGQGSIFTVRLPLSIDTAPSSDSAHSHVPESKSGVNKQLRILVVDDHEDAANALAGMLALKGHLSQVAHSGPDALVMARQFRPDVAFLDIGMPGMDGYATAQALRQMAGVDAPVLIALTGWGTKADRTRAARAGFNHHLTKPAALGAIDALLLQIAGARP